jgi:CRP/FNR family transcriptional regulator
MVYNRSAKQPRSDDVHASAPARPPACANCHLRNACVTSALSESSHAAFGGLLLAHRRVKAGQAVYRTGDSFSSIYVLKAGFVKTLALFEDGREQISGFYMPGDAFGVEGVASGSHVSDAIALDDVDVCLIPYDALERLSLVTLAAQRSLYRMFSQEILRRQESMTVLSGMSASQRVATFLVDLSRRFSARGLSPSEFLLRMTRDEIGSLLGLKLETVSRAFSKLHNDGLVEVDGKHVRIVSSPGLRALITH